jgi:hypothetical protein
MRRYVPLARKVNLNAMLPGGAPVAVRLFADIRLYRADGVEAFSDITAEATQQRNNMLVAAAIFAGMVLKAVERQERVFHDYPEGTVIVKEIYPGLAVNRARPGQEIGDDQRLRAVLRLPLQRQRAAPVRRQEPVERVP